MRRHVYFTTQPMLPRTFVLKTMRQALLGQLHVSVYNQAHDRIRMPTYQAVLEGVAHKLEPEDAKYVRNQDGSNLQER